MLSKEKNKEETENKEYMENQKINTNVVSSNPTTPMTVATFKWTWAFELMSLLDIIKIQLHTVKRHTFYFFFTTKAFIF